MLAPRGRLAGSNFRPRTVVWPGDPVTVQDVDVDATTR